MPTYDIDDFVALATGKAQLQPNIDWEKLFDKTTLKNMTQYCNAHYTEIDYVVVPFFAMCCAVTGKQTTVDSGLIRPGRTNLYLLMAGSPTSGKTCGFELAVNAPKVALEKKLGLSLVSNDLSKTALIKELQSQTENHQPFLILGKY